MPAIRYKTIVDDISARIGSGALRPGAQLPTLRALMRQHRIALATASRVYGELEAAGLVACEPAAAPSCATPRCRAAWAWSSSRRAAARST